MTPAEFKQFLSTIDYPVKIIIEIDTPQKISKSIFGDTVRKYQYMVAWVNFHTAPQRFTESDDKNYFRIPAWGSGKYPIFRHEGMNKEYIGVLPENEEEKDYRFYCETTKEQLQEKEVRRYLPKNKPSMEGYPTYFNVAMNNVLRVLLVY